MMLKTITPNQMKTLEARFMDETGYPGLLLMEHAAQALVQCVMPFLNAPNTRVLVLCGAGQNGGDGYAMARLLGGKCTIWHVGGETSGDALFNARLLDKMDTDIQVLSVDKVVPPIDSNTTVIVDALFGIGLSRPVEGAFKAVIEVANASGIPIIAVDIPSGINGHNGQVMGAAIRATQTLTFHRPKRGLYLNQAVDYTGTITVADIGIPASWDDVVDASILLPNDFVNERRLRYTHKGDYGKVLVVAGAMGYAGAAALCAKAAIKAGAGLVTVACDENIVPIIQTLVPCAICVPLPASGQAAAQKLEQLAQKASAIAIGPGLSMDDHRIPLLKVLKYVLLPKVYDADALNLIATNEALAPIGEQHVFTPHPGEAARLNKCDVKEIEEDAVSAAYALLAKYRGTVLLKGTTSIIASRDKLSFNITGTPAMAKGGSGDVLTGIIAALMAKGKPPYDAACIAALMHGMAGVKATENNENGLDALQLVAAL